MRIYAAPNERAAVRGGMMDAATLCDTLADHVEHTGRPSKQRAAIATALRQAGDAIMAMRQMVEVPQNAE